jgi:hypothetical protein
MKSSINETKKLIPVYLQAGISPDRIFINFKQAGVEIAAHKIRSMIRIASNRMMRERVVGQ